MSRTSLLLSLWFALTLAAVGVRLFEPSAPVVSAPSIPAAQCVFNESQYLQLNPDVARAVAKRDFLSGAQHFDKYGRGEGRAGALACEGMRTNERTDFDFQPCDFNEISYLQMNPDVDAAVKRGAVESGVAHYLRFGRKEGRSPNIDCPKPATAPSPAPPQRCAFNESEYLQLNPDVARAVAHGDFASGAAHFASFGRNEGRAPAFDCEGMKTNQRTDFHFAPCDFNESSYLSLHTDVAIAVKQGAVESGVAHYLRFGRKEGRRVSLACPEQQAQSPIPTPQCTFNESQYLMLNPDVARAVGLKQFASGAAHFERFGRGEGRAPAFNCPGTLSRDRADLKYDPCDYNETNYLSSNPDVGKAIARGAEASGVAHFLREGRRDERMPYGRCHFPSR